MAKYIDADTVVSMPFLDDSYGIEKHTVETDTIENLLDRFTKEGCPEPADVAQIRHSRWIKTADGAECEKCGREAVYQIVDDHWEYEPWCPHCGSKMDKAEEDNEQ